MLNPRVATVSKRSWPYGCSLSGASPACLAAYQATQSVSKSENEWTPSATKAPEFPITPTITLKTDSKKSTTAPMIVTF